MTTLTFIKRCPSNLQGSKTRRCAVVNSRAGVQAFSKKSTGCDALREHRSLGSATSESIGAPSLGRGIMADKEQAMGDKGGKKDKEKSKQQHAQKQKQEAERKQDKARPKTP
ncbi:MAG TPA: hypothetical protein VKA59_00615 [Vicinamibacterales bacterium]|jgi:hypothetical protein|nr:hypothetical protein [Vicinamibacterales bacterium]